MVDDNDIIRMAQKKTYSSGDSGLVQRGDAFKVSCKAIVQQMLVKKEEAITEVQHRASVLVRR